MFAAIQWMKLRSSKESEISEDQMHNWQDDVQKFTDAFIKELDELLEKKEQEIMQV